jgi:hypothetical protein
MPFLEKLDFFLVSRQHSLFELAAHFGMDWMSNILIAAIRAPPGWHADKKPPAPIDDFQPSDDESRIERNVGKGPQLFLVPHGEPDLGDLHVTSPVVSACASCPIIRPSLEIAAIFFVSLIKPTVAVKSACTGKP